MTLYSDESIRDVAERAYRMGFRDATNLLANEPEPLSAGDWTAAMERGAESAPQKLRDDGISGEVVD